MEPKLCPKCKQVSTNFHKNKAAKDGLQYHCIDCRKVLDKRPDKRKQDRERYHKNRDQYLDKFYLRTYGITLEEYNKLLDSQKGVCAICKSNCPTNRRLAVDHCHKTGQVRGLLCVHCNQGIGHLQDDPELLQEAIYYLRRKYG